MNTENHIGKRIIACIFDYSVIIIYKTIIDYYFGGEIDKISGITGISVVLFWFTFIVFVEFHFGATFGNQLVGLKPISLNNKNLTLKQSFKRHILDIVDFAFAMLIIKNTKKNQRLGDLWSKTIVVKK